MWRRTEQNEGPHLDPPDLTRWHTLCPHVSLSSHTHTYQHKHHTHRKFLLVPLFPPPLHIHTQGNGISCRDIIFVSLSRTLSFLMLSLPRPSPSRPLYPCLSRIRNTHTYLSRPCQIHQLHIHTCYIMYPIDLKIPLFTFISHTTFLLNKVWPIFLEFLNIYNIIKLYGGVWTLICIAWCPQWYLFRTVNFYIFILYKKLVIIKRNEEYLSLHRIHPLYAPFTYAHKLSPSPLKVRPQHIHACFIFLSRYIQWRSLYLKGKHDTYIGLQNPHITVTIYVLWLLHSHGLTV